ncbi:MAG: polysaccharide deacetylase family protein, partial [Thermodesulfobacteriota bacterium]
MPWKDGYTISDERSMGDEDVEWADNYQCAIGIVVDYSVRSGSYGIGPEDLGTHEAEFGARVGIWRLFDLFEKYSLRATFAVPAIMGEAHPENVREIIKRGHEAAAHGYRHEDVSGLDMEEEKRRLELTTQILEDLSGKRPLGWYSLPRQQDRYPG